MKTKLITLATVLVTAFQSLNAQVSNYNFSQFIGNYGASNSGTMVGTVYQDDNENLVALPFPFTFNGNTYSNVYVNSNGFITFTNSLQPSQYNPISDFSEQVISAFGQDLYMGNVTMGEVTQGSNTITNVSSLLNIQVGDSIADWNFDFGGISPTVTAISGNNIVVNVNSTTNNSIYDLFVLNGSIRMNLTGSAPNRVCEFIFKNMTRYSIYEESINFKIRLYETSNNIEFVYGNITVANSGIPAEVGLKGFGSSDYKSRLVNNSNTWATSLPATSIISTCAFNPGNFPANNLTYLWTTTTCATPTLNVTQTNTLICTGSSATINVSGATTYSWSNGSNNNLLVVTPSVTTTYTVTGFNGSCSATQTVVQTVSNCTGVEEATSFRNAVKVYPNPFVSGIHIKHASGSGIQYHITDLTGKSIISGKSETTDTYVDMSAFPAGIYFITMNSESQVITEKVVKTN